MSIDTRCEKCGLYIKGGSLCALRFSKCRKPIYHYIRQKTADGGVQNVCVSIDPAHRVLQNGDGTCREWRNICGKSEQEIMELKRE
jgi:hypothetical protein